MLTERGPGSVGAARILQTQGDLDTRAAVVEHTKPRRHRREEPKTTRPQNGRHQQPDGVEDRVPVPTNLRSVPARLAALSTQRGGLVADLLPARTI